MKYILFAIVALSGIPLGAVVALYSKPLRDWMLGALVFSTVLGDMGNINFLSMESYRGPDRGFEINLTDLLAASLTIVLLFKYADRVLWMPFNTTWMVAYFLVALISTFTSSYPLLGLFTLFKLIKMYIIYWCVLNCLRCGFDLEMVWYGIMGMAIVIPFLALKQKYINGIYRISGPFDHSNSVPLFANQIMPFLLIWGLCDKRFPLLQALLSILGSLGLVFAVVATFSRAGMALSALCLVGVLMVSQWRARSVRVTLTSITVFILVSAGSVKVMDSLIDRFQNAPEASEQAREEFNYAAKIMVKDRLFGVGLNQFSYALTRNSRYNEHIQVMANEEQSGVCHHLYLLTAAEMGYPGLVVSVILILRFLWLAAWHGFRSKSLPGTLLIGLFFGGCAVHLSNFLEWCFRITPIFYLYVILSAITVYLASEARSLRKA
ncbi:MAG TPA: O-antigen ligase family protein [bacterium]|nr:O-antigen ligase family protein [bacterium]